MPQNQPSSEPIVVAEDGTVEVTVERRRSVSREGVQHLPGDNLRLSLVEARELDAQGFITPLDGSERWCPGLSTNGPTVKRDNVQPGRIEGGGNGYGR